MKMPQVVVDMCGEGIAWKAGVSRDPTLARAVRYRGKAKKTGEIPLLRGVQHREGVAWPTHHLAHDPDDERRRGDHESGVRSEVGGNLDAISAWTNADPCRLPIRREQHDGRGKQIREEQRELLDAP